ncbi:MAG: hypothetical protein ABR987_05040 [Terracidiphilus sp.]|jgi:hypothetical protein
MNQTLHIFKKDARRLWPEILISLALTAGLVLTVPYKWANLNSSQSNYLGSSVAQLLAFFVELLVPVSWWLLIARAIHSESLVGDRQFWITRPYEWKKLLMAKALFVAAFLYLPLLTAQWLLLLRAGLARFSALPGLLYNLLFISIVVVLPLIALAAVTRNLARMTLTLLGALVGLWLLIALSSLTSANSIAAPVAGFIAATLILCVCSAAVVWQYATRKAGPSRALLIAAPVLLVAAQLIAPGEPDVAMMDRTYAPPAASSGGTEASLQVSYNPQAAIQPSAFVPRMSNSVGIEIPVQISGVRDGTIVDAEDVKVAIESQDGSNWYSSWQPLFRQEHAQKNSTFFADFTLPRKVYDQFKDAPVTLHLNLALKQIKSENVTRLTSPRSEYSVPDVGNCQLQVVLSNPDPVTGVVRASNNLDCRFGLRIPLTQVTASWTYKPCLASQTDLGPVGPLDYAIYWAGSADASPLELPLIPFQTQNESFSNGLNGGPDKRFCPDKPSLTFTQYSLLRRVQAEVSIQEFHLPAPTNGQLKVIENP